MLCHSHASRARLELLLVQHTVHLTGLAARRGGAGPAGRGKGNKQIVDFSLCSNKHLIKEGIPCRFTLQGSATLRCVADCVYKTATNPVFFSFLFLPVRAGGGCSAPSADRRGSRLHVHPTSKQLQIHVHL